jgi:hypothetical protein
VRKKLVSFTAALAAIAALAVGGSAIATAGQKPTQPKQPAVAQQPVGYPEAQSGEEATAESEASSEPSGEKQSSEPDGDAAAQAAACNAVGIDPNADNVQFDDQSGSCTLDGG